eukprot:scaffold2574_cov98-Cylindrotheca_fusiformis.AAC.8
MVSNRKPQSDGLKASTTWWIGSHWGCLNKHAQPPAGNFFSFLLGKMRRRVKRKNEASLSDNLYPTDTKAATYAITSSRKQCDRSGPTEPAIR